MLCTPYAAVRDVFPLHVTRLGKTYGASVVCRPGHWRKAFATSGDRYTTRSTCPFLSSMRTVPCAKSMAVQGKLLTSPTRRPHRNINKNHIPPNYVVEDAYRSAKAS